MSTVIASVDPGSPAERAGIHAGERLLTLNRREIVDVLDYRFFCYDPVLRKIIIGYLGDHLESAATQYVK